MTSSPTCRTGALAASTFVPVCSSRTFSSNAGPSSATYESQAEPSLGGRELDTNPITALLESITGPPDIPENAGASVTNPGPGRYQPPWRSGFCSLTTPTLVLSVRSHATVAGP